METVNNFVEHHRGSLSSFGVVAALACGINVLFFLQMYYDESWMGFLVFNALFVTAVGVFWMARLAVYVKDKMSSSHQIANTTNVQKIKGNSLMYSFIEEMKSWTYYFDPGNLDYLVEFYLGSQIVGLLFKWCSSFGFILVTVNGYLVKRILKDRYGMTLADFKTKVVQKLKERR